MKIETKKVEKTKQESFFSKLDSLKSFTVAVTNLFLIFLFVIPPLAIIILVVYSLFVLLRTGSDPESDYVISIMNDDSDSFWKDNDPSNPASPLGSVLYDEDLKRWYG